MNNATRSVETTKTIGAPIESGSVSRAVVDAVADAKGVSPVDVYPPLYDAVDPDALEQFVSSITPGSTAKDVHVTFYYAGFEITVTGDGAVALEAE